MNYFLNVPHSLVSLSTFVFLLLNNYILCEDDKCALCQNTATNLVTELRDLSKLDLRSRLRCVDLDDWMTVRACVAYEDYFLGIVYNECVQELQAKDPCVTLGLCSGGARTKKKKKKKRRALALREQREKFIKKREIAASALEYCRTNLAADQGKFDDSIINVPDTLCHYDKDCGGNCAICFNLTSIAIPRIKAKFDEIFKNQETYCNDAMQNIEDLSAYTGGAAMKEQAAKSVNIQPSFGLIFIFLTIVSTIFHF